MRAITMTAVVSTVSFVQFWTIWSQAHAAPGANGKATVYADSFAGKKTASGKKYRPHELTAASNRLPIGSKVQVTNRKNGKKVTVVINDKMARNSKAVVDLSKGAANKLGVKGVAPVSTHKLHR
ncbi:MAG: hypothetical protein JST89_13750 [Cyanobacteria bacterium SZAS-4]|nr:hypothetical protein [Cyanobacteria bacterium SZAS-4]